MGCDSCKTDLSKTVLNEWHKQHKAKMVNFGGWEMPVQYETGIINEHLSLRRKAALFDISHMSRFEIGGQDALPFLQYILTNNAAALEVGDAQYSILSNEKGVAIDDAFLYKVNNAKYWLVTNAGHRQTNWEWLQEHISRYDFVYLQDRTDDLGMIALQGPTSSEIMAEILGSRKLLPENRRNKLGIASIGKKQVVISNTGYTGEGTGVEMSVGNEFLQPFCEMILKYEKSHGVSLAGLGARDTARIEACLPLGGHEFPKDPSGDEMPIFSIGRLAKIAVSIEKSKGEYIGKSGKGALFEQRMEYDKLQRGELKDVPLEERILKKLIQPVRMVEGTRPLRQGSKIYRDEKHVGWITSGTTVPFTHFYGEGVTAVPSDQHGMRSIGMAYIDSDIIYKGAGYKINSEHIIMDVMLVSGSRGVNEKIKLVKTHMKSLPPYSRPLTAEYSAQPTKKAAPVKPEDLERIATEFVDEVAKKTIETQQQKILLVPSEITMTPLSRFISIAFAGKYAEHTELIPGNGEQLFYPDAEHLLRYEEMLASQYATFFDVPFVEVRPISGQMANSIAFEAIRKYKNRFRKGMEREGIRAIVKSLLYGGHLSSQPSGALDPSLGFDDIKGRLAVETFPMQRDNPYKIDVEKTMELVYKFNPDVLVFGGSMIIGREPVKEIADGIHNLYGEDNPNRPILMYDAAHVAGLFGPYFQNPIQEGIDIVTASTHKTIYSQQRGIILGNIRPDDELFMLWEPFRKDRTFPGHLSSHHPGTLTASYLDIMEMNAFKDEYQRKIIDSANVFAEALEAEGMHVEKISKWRHSYTHQVLINVGHAKGNGVSSLLEQAFINTNPQALPYDSSFAEASGLRTGINEMVKRGFDKIDWETTACFIADIYQRNINPETIKEAVIKFRSQERFRGWRYALPMEKAEPLALKMVEAVWGSSLYKR